MASRVPGCRAKDPEAGEQGARGEPQAGLPAVVGMRGQFKGPELSSGAQVQGDKPAGGGI